MDLDRIDRAQGCLLGQLAGDSLGSLVEFLDEERIKMLYPDGVRDLADGGTYDTIAGQPTDDSEMALMLARSLAERGRYDAQDALSRYRMWLESGPFDCGFTIMSSLKGTCDAWSQANGALMRVSPLGIFGAGQKLSDTARWAEEDAALTHVNPLCGQINALYVMAIATAVREPISPEDLFGRIETWAVERKVEEAVLAVIDASRQAPPVDYCKHQGWVLIAFGNALWQLLHAPDLEQGVIDTVRRGGDTDTNGAIAGALLGAVHGRRAIPARWQEKILQCRPQEGAPGVAHPRPECFWPVDALELAVMLLESGTPREGIFSRLSGWLPSFPRKPKAVRSDIPEDWAFEILPCLDTPEMVLRNRENLSLDHAAARRQGLDAVEIIRAEGYRDAAGGWVDLSAQIATARIRCTSIPPTVQLAKPFAPKISRMRIQVANETTLMAGRRLDASSGSRPLLLNFANGTVPGGGFLEGALAQEECLCRSSALHATLLGDPMYDAHAQRGGEDSTDWAILSRDVPVFREDSGALLSGPWLADFLTCAAPVAFWMDPSEAARLLDLRIRRVLSIARSHRYTALVLGAWGCGAFGNDPETTARSFRRHLEGDFAGSFSDVIFAIADTSGERVNLRPFQDVFEAA